jgi:hypothetical protein
VTKLCAVEGCAVRGRHISDDCPDDCTGCMPRLALADSLVCDRDWTATTNGLRELPLLHEDLLTPTRAGGSGPRITGTTEKKLPQQDRPRDTRDRIREILAEWCITLADSYRLTLPDGHVQSLADHVRTHASTLMRDVRYADQLVADVRNLLREARRVAYPSAPQGQALGPCPVIVDGEQCGNPLRARSVQALVACSKCGTVDTPAGVLLRPTPEAARPMTTAQLVDWLTNHVAKVPSEATIRKWAERGHIARLGLEGKEQTYDPLAVLVRVKTSR